MPAPAPTDEELRQFGAERVQAKESIKQILRQFSAKDAQKIIGAALTDLDIE